MYDRHIPQLFSGESETLHTSAYVISQVMSRRYYAEVLVPWETNWLLLLDSLTVSLPSDVIVGDQHLSVRWRFQHNEEPQETLGIVARIPRNVLPNSQTKRDNRSLLAYSPESLVTQIKELETGGNSMPVRTVSSFGHTEENAYYSLRKNLIAMPIVNEGKPIQDTLYDHYETVLLASRSDSSFVHLQTVVAFILDSKVDNTIKNGNLWAKDKLSA